MDDLEVSRRKKDMDVTIRTTEVATSLTARELIELRVEKIRPRRPVAEVRDFEIDLEAFTLYSLDKGFRLNYALIGAISDRLRISVPQERNYGLRETADTPARGRSTTAIEQAELKDELMQNDASREERGTLCVRRIVLAAFKTGVHYLCIPRPCEAVRSLGRVRYAEG